MSTVPLPPRLQPLVACIDGLNARAPIERVRTLLEVSAVILNDVREFVVFASDHYRRNLLGIGPWQEILVICWQSGQRSPIHNHAASTCGLKVLGGVCTETIFDHSPCGQVVALSSQDLGIGYVCTSEDADTHQVSNLQTEGQNLVTAHIYSPPFLSMKKFSITGPSAEDWRPPVFEFSQGAGI
jgi:cysteine dioxygenase